MTLRKRLNGFDDVTRREFVSGAAAGMLGLTAMPWLTSFASAAD